MLRIYIEFECVPQLERIPKRVKIIEGKKWNFLFIDVNINKFHGLPRLSMIKETHYEALH